jgi:flagellar basal-body rod modification protein FlgD
MSISALTDPTVTAAPALAGAVNSARSATEDRFLTLLVTQMRNQDPLNPLDNAQVTSQLAQLSTVSGIEKLNATMGTLLGSLTALQPIQASSLVGKSVAIGGNTLELAAGKGRGGLSVEGSTTGVAVTVADASGKAVRTIDLGARSAGIATFDWDGKDDKGNRLPDGSYTFTVTATGASGPVTARPLAVATVRGVIPASDGFALNLGAAGIVAFSSIAQIL